MRRWVVAALAGWALAVGGAALVSSRRGDDVTAREQTSVSDARPTVDRTVTRLVGAGLDAGAVVSVSPFTRLGECRISAVRDGSRWEQATVFYVRPGGEDALLDRLASAVGSRARSAGGARTLRADVGDYVGISGGPAQPGEVRVTVATGCRAGTAQPSSPSPVDSGAVDAVLGALGVPAARRSGYEVPCPSGGAVRVVSAEGEPASRAPLPAVLASVGAAPVLAEAERYAYRLGSTSVVVHVSGSVVTVTATTPCPS